MQQEDREALGFLEPNLPSNDTPLGPDTIVDPGDASSLAAQVAQMRRELQRLSVTHTETVCTCERERVREGVRVCVFSDAHKMRTCIHMYTYSHTHAPVHVHTETVCPCK